jgi:hypothetical protein
MTKFIEKRKVVELRKQGKSYSEIRKIIKVSKASLSLWLKDVILTNEQIVGLKMKKVRAVERYKISMKEKRQSKLDLYYKNQLKRWFPLSERERFIAGLFLYLGEGNKASRNNISIANTDPSVMKFALYWFLNCLKIQKEKVRLNLHLYDDMNIENEIDFWLKELNLSRTNLNKPYIKKSFRTDIDQKGYGHGTCTLSFHDTVLKDNLIAAIRVITNKYRVNMVKFDIIT